MTSENTGTTSFPSPSPSMMDLARALFPICRSITGDGVRETLAILKQHIPLAVHEVPTGTPVFDWVVPREWNIRNAYVEDSAGHRLIDFHTHNLHVLNYSTPVDTWVNLDELQEHLYSVPELPEAIPYVSSYYTERWGFCLEHRRRESLQPGTYHAVIDSELRDGSLTYADLVIPGESEEEVFFTTYICHPSMANNELSGPVLNTFLAAWVQTLPRRRYTYRFVFAPETIGALVYLSRHVDHLRRHVVAGFNVTCAGDDHGYSWVASPDADTVADRVMEGVLSTRTGRADKAGKAGKAGNNAASCGMLRYSYLERASDERQYCAPGVELPLVTFCRSRFRTYPEYHTSLDNLSLISEQGLAGSLEVLKECVLTLEHNCIPQTTVLGEPQLGKRGLYPTISRTGATDTVESLLNLIAYANGKRDLLTISQRIGVPVGELWPMVENLKSHGLLQTLPCLSACR